jgi:hypothetical protein
MNDLKTNNTIVDNNEYYLRNIKPVSLILRIFKNIFSGRYIHIGSFIQLKEEMIMNIFKYLCDLMCSLKLEDFMGYLNKMNSAYYLIKVIFCDYSDFVKFECFYIYIDYIMKIIDEGIECLDNVAVISVHNIVRIYS